METIVSDTTSNPFSPGFLAADVSDIRSEDKSPQADNSSSDDESDRDGDNKDNDGVIWDAQTEIYLFESIGKLPPIGINKYFSIINSTVYLQKHSTKNITTQQVVEHLRELYNLDALDDIDIDTTIKDFALPEEDFGSLVEERLAEKGGTRVVESKTDEETLDSPGASENGDKEESEPETKQTRSKRRHEPRNKERSSKRHSSPHNTAQESPEPNKDKTKYSPLRVKKEKADPAEDTSPSPLSSPLPSSPSPPPSSSSSTAKYATFSEFIYGALQDLGGTADLQTLYNYVAEHSHEVDKKYASRFENGLGKSSSGYKSNVRSTLHNNQCFIKLQNGQWTINPSFKKPVK
jgi:hypothetical protein